MQQALVATADAAPMHLSIVAVEGGVDAAAPVLPESHDVWNACRSATDLAQVGAVAAESFGGTEVLEWKASLSGGDALPYQPEVLKNYKSGQGIFEGRVILVKDSSMYRGLMSFKCLQIQAFRDVQVSLRFLVFVIQIHFITNALISSLKSW